MSETNLLINSPIPPRWYRNINYQYNAAEIHFVRTNPGVVKPGGRIIERTGTVSDDYLSARKHKGLVIELLNFDLERDLNFEMGDLVSICIRLFNPSKRSIRLPFPLSQTSRDFVATLARPNGETVRLKLQKGCCSSLSSILLKSQTSKYLSLNLFFDNFGYLFYRPGTYRIECFIRTLGAGGGWHSSGLTDLVIRQGSDERQQLMNQMYTKKLKSHVLGGGFKPVFTAGFFRRLRQLQAQEPSFAVPLSWLAINFCKNEILLSNDSKRTQKAVKQLTFLYQFLNEHEPFTIRRGKIQNDYTVLRLLKKATESGIVSPEFEAYQQIKDDMINRKPNLHKKQDYEKKILAV